MANISPTIKINISRTPCITKNISVGASFSPMEVAEPKHLFQEFCDIFAWSYKEMPILDPTIIEHHIDTWTNASPICQKKYPMHLTKVLAIKVEIDKLCQAEFIFPIEYTPWVCNPIIVTKK